jgi:hypothetical protein
MASGKMPDRMQLYFLHPSHRPLPRQFNTKLLGLYGRVSLDRPRIFSSAQSKCMRLFPTFGFGLLRISAPLVEALCTTLSRL